MFDAAAAEPLRWKTALSWPTSSSRKDDTRTYRSPLSTLSFPSPAPSHEALPSSESRNVVACGLPERPLFWAGAPAVSIAMPSTAAALRLGGT